MCQLELDARDNQAGSLGSNLRLPLILLRANNNRNNVFTKPDGCFAQHKLLPEVSNSGERREIEFLKVKWQCYRKLAATLLTPLAITCTPARFVTHRTKANEELSQPRSYGISRLYTYMRFNSFAYGLLPACISPHHLSCFKMEFQDNLADINPQVLSASYDANRIGGALLYVRFNRTWELINRRHCRPPTCSHCNKAETSCIIFCGLKAS
jgi:hypothetical protein